mgnify:CR=1 FL=1
MDHTSSFQKKKSLKFILRLTNACRNLKTLDLLESKFYMKRQVRAYN